MFSGHSKTAFLLCGVCLLSACATAPVPDDGAQSSASSADAGTGKCVAAFMGEPDTTVTYTNVDKGISFDIPYNDGWGYEDAPLPAFVEHDAGDVTPLGSVLFGPPTYAGFWSEVETCDLLQSYELTFLPARTAAAAVRTIEGRGTEVVPNATVRTIGDLTVVQYTDVGLCNYPTLEVVGATYNYSFTTSGCEAAEDTEWKYLESIVQSVQLTQ